LANSKAVAQICLSKSWGGLEMSSLKWTEIFQEKGYDSYLICKMGSVVHKTAEKRGLKVLPLNSKDYFDPKSTRQISSWSTELGFRAVFLHRLTDLWLVRISKIPSEKVFGFARIFLKNNPKKDFLHSWLYRGLSKLIALSEIQKKHLLNCLPIEEQKIKVIPNGIRLDKFKGERNSLLRKSFCKDTEILLGLVGRFDKQKGQVQAVRAFAEVQKRFPNIKLLLIGAETEGQSGYQEEVQNLIASLGLNDRVILESFREDMPDVLAALDIFLMPSYEENFANVLLEAMVSGCACLASNSGGTPEILDFGAAGVLVEPRSHEDLAKGMLVLLESKEVRLKLATLGQERARSLYDLNKVFAQVEKLMN
jgi:glycosyltransferase involved in cell wall biosynthesis